jgi:hypothetical protein
MMPDLPPLQVGLSESEFAACWSEVDLEIDLSKRLPAWPFRSQRQHVAIAESLTTRGIEYVPALQSLASRYGDEELTLVAAEPPPSWYFTKCSFWPGFRIRTDALGTHFGAGLSYDPVEDREVAALFYTADVVGIVGTSRCWSLYTDRVWELTVLHTSDADGEWLRTSVPFLSAIVAVDGLARAHQDLSEAQRTDFLANFGTAVSPPHLRTTSGEEA